MSVFTEVKTLKSLKLVPELDIIITEHAVTLLKDGVKVSETLEGRSYSNLQTADFEMNVATLGASLAEIVASFNSAAAAERDAAVEAETLAKAQIATLQAQIDAYTPPAPLLDAEGPTVDDLQIRLALNARGLRDAVEAAVAASDQSIKDWFQRARNFKRLNPMVISIGQAVGVTDEELDALWALAATL